MLTGDPKLDDLLDFAKSLDQASSACGSATCKPAELIRYAVRDLIKHRKTLETIEAAQHPEKDHLEKHAH